MPKLKTHRLARKKFRVMAKGRLKRGRAATSHNTGKKSAKRMRQLRGTAGVHTTNQEAIYKLLPNG